MPKADDFGPSWTLTEPKFGDTIELYHKTPEEGEELELYICVGDIMTEHPATIILTKLQATALRDQLSRMIEAMP